ncbi:MAG: signal peptidase II [Lachnospiraceae bacterium]
MKKIFHLFIYTILVLILFSFDQITKYLAVVHLKNQSPIPIIDGIFELYYLENRGAAFGVLEQQKILLVFVTSTLLILLILFLFRIPDEKRFLLLKGIVIFLISGALGNLIDRIRNDYVIDFFFFKPINFPVFNVADIYVTTAAAAFAVSILFIYKEEDLNRILPGFFNKK